MGLADARQMSASAALTGRTHGRTDQCCIVQKVLANPVPSTHHLASFAATHHLGRYWTRADIDRNWR
jgi:hypothetical protein